MSHKAIRGLLGGFVCLATIVGLCVAGSGGSKSELTAAVIVERIKDNVNCEWSKQTVDTFKAGDPDTEVTGVAVTCFATLDVLKKAVDSGCNFVITHEPTFYHHSEDTARIEGDAVLAAKRKFIADNGLVIWRFHDHIHKNNPDGIVAGVVEMFDWARYQKADSQFLFEMPETTVGQFARSLKQTLGGAVVRVIGDADMKFTRFAFAPGAPGSTRHLQALGMDEIEVLVGGETCEWETVEYVRDAVSAGKRKAFIVLGHCNSEEAGMRHCAKWLRGFVKEKPVKFIAAGDPFWSP